MWWQADTRRYPASARESFPHRDFSLRHQAAAMEYTSGKLHKKILHAKKHNVSGAERWVRFIKRERNPARNRDPDHPDCWRDFGKA